MDFVLRIFVQGICAAGRCVVVIVWQGCVRRADGRTGIYEIAWLRAIRGGTGGFVVKNYYICICAAIPYETGVMLLSYRLETVLLTNENRVVMIKEIAGHRSVRQYRSDAVPQEVLDEILAAAVRASTVGNMQLYSIVVTTSRSVLDELAPLHFNQPAATTAPVLMTFCADVHRFSMWCRQRGAEPGYDNFCWFMNAVTDALLASQNAVLEAEAHGLGICYLGTTLYNAREIAGVLRLPAGVMPVMTVSVGYPVQMPPLTDRLPVDAVVHYDTYTDYTPEEIDRLWREREASAETAELLAVNGLPNLARIFTERRYPKADNVAFSRKYFDDLVAQGFFEQ